MGTFNEHSPATRETWITKGLPSSINNRTADTTITARLPGFYKLSIDERVACIRRFADLSRDEGDILGGAVVLSQELLDTFVENAIGSFALPFGIATNFLINNEEQLIPMAVEESSVIAAASHGAKLARFRGGFVTSSTEAIMTGQIQLLVKSNNDFGLIIDRHKSQLIEEANRVIPRLVARGGGTRDISWRFIPEIASLVIHVDIDTKDAMGANIVNTVCEHLAPWLARLIPCDIGLKILTNLADKRLARARCIIPKRALAKDEAEANLIMRGIEQAYLFAKYDIYRAATHNKGVMNGIDPLIIATGNDWRAIEAGAHAYCSRHGSYQPLTHWHINECDELVGEIEMPMALGTVGGVTKLHPTAAVALKILANPSARQLGEVACAVGLAQNLSALRALATEGIAKGHMRLHQKNLDLLNLQDSQT